MKILNAFQSWMFYPISIFYGICDCRQVSLLTCIETSKEKLLDIIRYGLAKEFKIGEKICNLSSEW